MQTRYSPHKSLTVNKPYETTVTQATSNLDMMTFAVSKHDKYK